ncbi:MAG: Crp/Fnr family transcriptional regulator [Leptospira sp.]|nr:Crp/Fnr family transcriptional regulator [Leptospira sp.]
MALKHIQKPGAEDLLNIFACCKEVEMDKNNFLFHFGDEIQYLDLLVQGELQIFKYDMNMNEVTMNFFKPVSIVAEWAVLQGIPYPASGRFTQKSKIRRMPISVFQEKLNQNVYMNHIVMYSLIQKIESLNSAVDRGLTMDSLQRVAHFLANCSEDCLNMKQNQISSLLYLRPETFSRMLKKLKDDGAINIQKGGHIEILDIEALKSYL